MFRECTSDRPRTDQVPPDIDRPTPSMRFSSLGLPLKRVRSGSTGSSDHVESKASSDVDLKELSKLPKYVFKAPSRPKSSRGGSNYRGGGSSHGHCPSSGSTHGSGSGSGIDRHHMGQPRALRSATDLLRVRPSPRPDGSTYSTHASSIGGLALGRLSRGSHNPSRGSLSSMNSSIIGDSALGYRLETPPGAPNAHEAHMLLVACPAPRRQERRCAARSRLQHVL